MNGANELFFKSNAAAAQYDAAGNMTAFCEPGTGTAGNPSTGTAETAVYDAWDRLVQVPGSTIVAQYRYLCPCQLGGADFLVFSRGRPNRGVGRSSLAHSLMAA